MWSTARSTAETGAMQPLAPSLRAGSGGESERFREGEVPRDVTRHAEAEEQYGAPKLSDSPNPVPLWHQNVELKLMGGVLYKY